MTEPAIIKASDHFFVTTYEGNGGGQKVGKFIPFTDNGTIAKSVIFNDGDSPQLSKTPSGAGNRRTFTFSVWVKRGALTGAEQYILSASKHIYSWPSRFTVVELSPIERTLESSISSFFALSITLSALTTSLESLNLLVSSGASSYESLLVFDRVIGII